MHNIDIIFRFLKTNHVVTHWFLPYVAFECSEAATAMAGSLYYKQTMYLAFHQDFVKGEASNIIASKTSIH